VFSVDAPLCDVHNLSEINRRDQRRISKKIDSLADVPRRVNARKLSGRAGIYRVRVGAYRILYQVEDEVLRVLVVRIRHKRDAYR
jgi:mRNA interferase RelE/StbE